MSLTATAPVVEKVGLRTYHVSDTNPPALDVEVRSYQVWSTVLGSSLTAIFANGNKAETKVFAGKAVIGIQGTVGIGWTTADAVTGTLGKFSYSEEYGTSFTKEETEPLGQRINNNDPEERPDPTYEIRLGNADDPQWQCEAGKRFYGSFTGMPIHCQMKALLNAGAKLPWEDEMPSHVPAPGPALPNNSPNNNEMPVNLNPTNKPPTLRKAENLTKEERSRRAALANTSIFDNEAEASGAPVVESLIQDEPSQEELEAALQTLAGPPVGPDGGVWDFLLMGLVELSQQQKQVRIWCDPAVIEQMKRAFSLTSNGTRRNAEAGFLVNGSRTNFKPTKAKTGNFYGKEQFRLQSNTIALFHVHHNNASVYPSTPENNFENNGKGDTGIADDNDIEVYVISVKGLSVYNPRTKDTTLLREGLDWQKPCN